MIYLLLFLAAIWIVGSAFVSAIEENGCIMGTITIVLALFIFVSILGAIF